MIRDQTERFWMSAGSSRKTLCWVLQILYGA